LLLIDKARATDKSVPGRSAMMVTRGFWSNEWGFNGVFGKFIPPWVVRKVIY
jgi:hypothetical protein